MHIHIYIYSSTSKYPPRFSLSLSLSLPGAFQQPSRLRIGGRRRRRKERKRKRKRRMASQNLALPTLGGIMHSLPPLGRVSGGRRGGGGAYHGTISTGRIHSLPPPSVVGRGVGVVCFGVQVSTRHYLGGMWVGYGE